MSSTTVRSSAIYCAFPIFFPGNANLLIGVLNWISEEPSWGSASPGAPNPSSALCNPFADRNTPGLSKCQQLPPIILIPPKSIAREFPRILHIFLNYTLMPLIQTKIDSKTVPSNQQAKAYLSYLT